MIVENSISERKITGVRTNDYISPENFLTNAEHAEQCLTFPSGKAAICAIVNTLSSGDEIIVPNDLSGSLFTIVEALYRKFGVEVVKTDLQDPEKLLGVITDKTQCVWLESPSIPGSRVYDISRLSDIAHLFNAQLVIDNSHNTYITQKAISHGADIVLYSDTTLLLGENTCGLILTNSEVPNPQLSHSQSLFHRINFPEHISEHFNNLPSQLKEMNNNALEIANLLSRSEKVARVYYSGLPHHPYHHLALVQQCGFGSFLSFYLNDDTIDAAERLICCLKRFKKSSILDFGKSTVYQPSVSTLNNFPAFARRRMGIRDSLIIIHAGTEKKGSLPEDILNALNSL